MFIISKCIFVMKIEFQKSKPNYSGHKSQKVRKASKNKLKNAKYKYEKKI